MEIEERLSRQLDKFASAPFLFVGSGISRRYLGLETWESLLRRFAGYLSRDFEYYFSKANRDLPQTASLMAEAFHELWWSSDQFKQSREAFGAQLANAESCLKFEIAQYIRPKTHVPQQDDTLQEEIDFLQKSQIDGAVTTNWDAFLENVFVDFDVYVGQEEILSASPQGVAEIYKIHGCCTQPNSLVVTASDYTGFNARNPYLAAKLLTMFLEHPFIFLGYSLSDRNVTEILEQIVACLSQRHLSSLSDRLIFVTRNMDSGLDAFSGTAIKLRDSTIPVTLIQTNDFRPILRCLGRLHRRFPAKLLRRPKRHVYELVLTNDPNEQMTVVDIDNEVPSDELKVVFGVGRFQTDGVGDVGYKIIDVTDLCQDVMLDHAGYDAERVVSTTLPKLIHPAKYVPVFKYLRKAGLIGKGGNVDTSHLAGNVAELANRTFQDFLGPSPNKRGEVRSKCHSVADVAKTYDVEHAIYFIPLLLRGQIRVDELRDFILRNMACLRGRQPNDTRTTYFRSLICLYDWLAFGPCADPVQT